MTRHEPQTLDKALYIRRLEKVIPYAGGTSFDGMETALPFLYLGGIDGLSAITKDENVLRIGAMCRLETAMEDLRVPIVLRRAINTVSPLSVRARATVGGALCSNDKRSCVPTVLVALGATVICRTRTTERYVAAADFFSHGGESLISPQGLVSAILLPTHDYTNASFETAATDNSVKEQVESVNFCGLASVKDGKITEFHSSFGGLSARPCFSAEIDGTFCGMAVKKLHADVLSFASAYRPILSDRIFEARGENDDSAVSASLDLLGGFIGKL